MKLTNTWVTDKSHSMQEQSGDYAYQAPSTQNNV